MVGETDLGLRRGLGTSLRQDLGIPFLLLSRWARAGSGERRAGREAGFGGRGSRSLAAWKPGRAGHSDSCRKGRRGRRARRREMAGKLERRAKGEGESERREKPGREKAAPRAGWAQAPRGSGNGESEAPAGGRARRTPPSAFRRRLPGAARAPARPGPGSGAGQGAGSRPAAERSRAFSRGSGRWSLLALTPRSARDAFLRTRREGRGAGTRLSVSRTRVSAPATVTRPGETGELSISRQ